MPSTAVKVRVVRIQALGEAHTQALPVQCAIIARIVRHVQFRHVNKTYISVGLRSPTRIALPRVKLDSPWRADSPTFSIASLPYTFPRPKVWFWPTCAPKNGEFCAAAAIGRLAEGHFPTF